MRHGRSPLLGKVGGPRETWPPPSARQSRGPPCDMAAALRLRLLQLKQSDQNHLAATRTRHMRLGRISSESASINSSVATYAGQAKTFTLAEIERATKRFEESSIIGEGGFGLVYQGTLEDGTRIAVKVLKRDDQQSGREFFAEIEMLSRLHHRNLVKLIGICVEEHIRCLVYELIPNGCLESHLHGSDKETSLLDWGARMRIALGNFIPFCS